MIKCISSVLTALFLNLGMTTAGTNSVSIDARCVNGIARESGDEDAAAGRAYSNHTLNFMGQTATGWGVAENGKLKVFANSLGGSDITGHNFGAITTVTSEFSISDIMFTPVSPLAPSILETSVNLDFSGGLSVGSSIGDNGSSSGRARVTVLAQWHNRTGRGEADKWYTVSSSGPNFGGGAEGILVDPDTPQRLKLNARIPAGFPLTLRVSISVSVSGSVIGDPPVVGSGFGQADYSHTISLPTVGVVFNDEDDAADLTDYVISSSSGNIIDNRWVPPAPLPFAVTDIDYSSSADEVAITWNSQPGEAYTLAWSTDGSDWSRKVIEGVDSQGFVTSYGPFPNPSENSGRVLFRLERTPEPEE